MINWWMKLGGNLPPGHNTLLFSISGTWSFICLLYLIFQSRSWSNSKANTSSTLSQRYDEQPDSEARTRFLKTCSLSLWLAAFSHCRVQLSFARRKALGNGQCDWNTSEAWVGHEWWIGCPLNCLCCVCLGAMERLSWEFLCSPCWFRWSRCIFNTRPTFMPKRMPLCESLLCINAAQNNVLLQIRIEHITYCNERVGSNHVL